MRALLVLASLFVMSTTAHATKIVGNGGDTYALEFVTVASELYDYMVLANVTEVNLADLKTAIEQTKVESTEEGLVLNGIPKDAINYPSELRIIFNRVRWNEMSEEQKPAIVLHEYLGILGIDDSSYRFSQPVLSDFGYGKNVIEVKGPFVVNFAARNEYQINAHVVIENYGPQSWHYNASEEKLRLVVDYKGKRRVFMLPARGRVISAGSTNDGEDDGLCISILQPVLDENGNYKKIIEADGSEYIPHVTRDYRVEFEGSVKDSIPEKAEFIGPINNMAG